MAMDGDTHVALLVSLRAMPPREIKSFVSHRSDCTYDSESNWPPSPDPFCQS